MKALKWVGIGFVVLLVVGTFAGCGADESATSDVTAAAVTTTPKSAPRPKALATPASFTRCLRQGGVRFHRDGAIPGDPNRTKRPLGWSGATSFSGARYLGAASFAHGGFTDVWLTRTAARAADLSESFADPTLNEAEATDWSFEHARNVLFAIYATGAPQPGDSRAFDRCLQRS